MSGAMPSGGPGSDVFRERLQWIEAARAPDPVDLTDAEGNPVPDRTEISPLPDWKENIRHPLGLVMAALLGMAAVFMARMARYHLSGGTLAGEDADITMLIDAGLAGACSFLLFSLLRFEGKEFKLAQTIGIVGMVAIMHNFVHAAPWAFNLLFAPEWTEDVLAETEPNSILFRGVTFALSGDSEPERTMPTVRRMN